MAPANVPAGENVPTWSSYSTALGSAKPRHEPSLSDQAKASWSTTRDGPWTPCGWCAERGSGRGGPPSMEKA
jgi:hypothetical protein